MIKKKIQKTIEFAATFLLVVLVCLISIYVVRHQIAAQDIKMIAIMSPYLAAWAWLLMKVELITFPWNSHKKSL